MHEFPPFRSVLRLPAILSGIAPRLMMLLTAALLAAALQVASPPAHAQSALQLITAAAGTKAETGTDTGTPTALGTTGGYDISAYDQMSKDMGQTMNETFQLRGALMEILRELPTLPASIGETLRSKSPDGSLDWFKHALIVVVIAVLAGTGTKLIFRRWAKAVYLARFSRDPETRTQKIAFLLGRGVVMALEIVVFLIGAWIVAVLLHEDSEASRITVMTGISAYTTWLAARLIFFNILAPDASNHRMLAISDDGARGLYNAIRAGIGVSIALLAICLWMGDLGINENARKLGLVGSAAASMLILSAIALNWRRDVAGAILGSGGTEPAAPVQFIARIWHALAILYFVFACGMSAVRILLDHPFAAGLVAAPVQSLIAALILYALLLLIIDRMLPRLDTRRAQARLANDIERSVEALGETPDDAASASQAEAEALENEAARSPYRELLDHGAGILTLVFSAWMLLRAWGISIRDNTSILGNSVEVAIVAFLGYMAYQAVEIAVAQTMRRENKAPSTEEPGEGEVEVGGPGDSRLSTLLPIFRNFLLITIVVISGMLILSQMGIDIAPLFAGAGVVGLAIGFGAQTLIRDIFSGAFYLIDDAFRKGEYIDIGGAKGTVEKISIRSMQLRHHRGALTTVPFGEIKHVQNYSRDWAIMKLAFRVTYDTDTEKMRKIIKKFGQELLNDPYYGPMFLDQLKSQGIMSMEDSAMIARVKFMSKPGKQFELRKVIYAGLQDLFEKNGIRFAHREVTVRVANEDGHLVEHPTPGQVAAAGAATLAGQTGAQGGSGASSADAR